MPVKAFAVNLRHPLKAVTEYDNYAFNSLCEIDGKYYGADSNGVYLLDGGDDDGSAIEAEVMTGVTDFETANLKRVPVGGADHTSAGPVVLTTLTVKPDEENPWEGHKIERRYGMNGRRRTLSKGVESARWAFGFASRNGKRFELRQLRLDVQELTLEER